MKVAVMQPYVFPYLGYFQLIQSVDNFVFYDDVNFIKQGWINRNRVLVGSKEHLFTIPVQGISSYVPINQMQLHANSYNLWSIKFLKSLEQSYRKAPHFAEVFGLIERILEEKHSIAKLAMDSVQLLSEYIGINTSFHLSSKAFGDTLGMDKADRLIHICKQLQASTYVNSIGGVELYDKYYFGQKNIELLFIKPVINPYKQFNLPFVGGLSIIDVLMFNSPDQVKDMVLTYELV